MGRVDENYKNIVLNTFARQAFRDVADKDYILARTCYRMGLINQFFWCGLQAVEKYLKAILLFNNKKTLNLNHDIKKSLKRVEGIKKAELDIDEKDREFVRQLNKFGNNRYLTKSFDSDGNELFKLDKLVWGIRRYCNVFGYVLTSSEFKKDIYEAQIKDIELKFYKDYPNKFQIFGGYLEKVLKMNIRNSQRENLVWC